MSTGRGPADQSPFGHLTNPQHPNFTNSSGSGLYSGANSGSGSRYSDIRGGNAGRGGGGRGGDGGGGGDAGCFPAGTLIQTCSGWVDISGITPTDGVLAFDPNKNMLRFRRIIAVRRYEKRRIWRITFADGNQIRVTSLHSFRVGSGWKPTWKLTAGEPISFVDRLGSVGTRPVARVEPTNEIEDVFNLIVDGQFSFIANGAIVHSFTYCRSLRVAAWSLYCSVTKLFETNDPPVTQDVRFDCFAPGGIGRLGLLS